VTHSSRILLGYLLVLSLTSWLLLDAAFDVLKPAMRQSAEETLIDTANLLAVLVTEDLKHGTLDHSHFAAKIHEFTTMSLDARIWGVHKTRPNHRIYITDAHGRVQFDSSGRDLGADYSRWNDVLRTLRGEYGARSTRENPDDERSTVMYVAAPIRDGERIIGALTVAKPNLTMEPFINRTQRKLLLGALFAFGGALLISIASSWWTTRSVRTLAKYAQAVSAGSRVSLPSIAEPEFAALGRALEDMRVRLDGKAYVEQYVQTLTHELKSPLAAILGAAELLHDELPAADRKRFLSNIESEASRIAQLIERLLDLAQLEQQRGLLAPSTIDVKTLVDEIIASREAITRARQFTVENKVGADCRLAGDAFLLRQALLNLLDNALAFTPPGGCIFFAARREGSQWAVDCHNSGAPIPDYALARLTERFFSLPRPDTGRKSSGLGLSLVAEVAKLHGGLFAIANDPAGGVIATLHLPAA
jgi:two-component system, OmpR family, sensor histidine kinase CreC